VLNARND